MNNSTSDYAYDDACCNSSHEYLVPAVLNALKDLRQPPTNVRIFELGCGNGAVAAFLQRAGYSVVGIDASESGIAQARRAFPELSLHVRSAYDDLAGEFGRFPVVLSLEVVEHLYHPRKFASCLYSLLEANGTAIVSTPYHGYWKYLALALTGRMDAHLTALWDYGHIKFWSIKTLTSLLTEAGFSSVKFSRVGRVPPLAKSMIAIAAKGK
jgi:2-polyprenyl-6-hydroxyphenyl methylase/3-demethylubiquinone-9 3-methyltransferase